MISDYNKSISSITYNYRNLPNVITITGKGTITYLYDADGNKLQKTILDQTVTPNKTTNYYYAGDYIYRNDTLEFVSHPEGRLRPVRIDTTQAISMANLKYLYDYYLKDHLDNVRSVLTTEQETDIYAATMETANAAKENALFSKISATATTKPAGFSNDNSNKMVSRLNGNVNISGNNQVGPGIILKVMTGDTISISTFSWYTGAVQPAATGVPAISTELISLLTAGVANENGGKGGAIPTAYSSPLLVTDIGTLVSDDSTTYVTTRPKAFLNWMVVGEDYTAATSSPNHVGAIQIPVCNAGDSLKQIVGPTNMVVRRNGWIYVYLSNQSNQDVYFDNLVLNLKHGPLVEQKDYYSFGMENPALSTQAIKQNYYLNRMKYNGKELQNKEFLDGSGLELYDFNARMYDPQLGRFLKIDPLTDFTPNITPYAFVGNNPILFCDPLGLDTVRITGDGSHTVQLKVGDVLQWTIGNTTSYYVYDPSSKDAVNGFVGAGMKDNDMLPVSVTAKSKATQFNKSSESSGTNSALPLVGAGLDLSAYKMFNKNKWFSLPQLKSYNPIFNGNGATGGRNVAKKLGKGLKWAGNVMLMIDVYNTITDDETSTGEKEIELAVTGISVKAGPIYGTAITVGWESGKAISKNEWYRVNIRPLIQDAMGVERDERFLNMKIEVPKQ